MKPDQIVAQLSSVSTGNVLLLAGLVLITYGLLHRDPNPTVERWIGGALTLFGLFLAAVVTIFSGGVSASDPAALLASDAMSIGVSWLTLLGGLFVVLIGWDRVMAGRVAETYGCLLLLLSGLVYAAAANDLTTLFLGLELVSIPTTVLLAITRADDSGREATLKYFTLAAFASCFFLLGCSYLYGVAGSTSIVAIQAALAANPTVFAKLGLALAICGLCFRVSAVPFHSYAPDVFSGASLSMAASLSFLPKVAGMVGILRLLGGAQLHSALSDLIIPILLVIAVITMTLGNCVALVQTRMRRLLAYSSIAHSGYLLFAVAALLSTGSTVGPILNYLAAYAAMTLGIFAVLAIVEQQTTSASDDIAEFQGLFARRPWLALCATVGLLSLTGLPLTAGFWAKLQIFVAGLASTRLDVRVVALIMAINAVIAAVYYLTIIYRMIAKDSTTIATLPPSSGEPTSTRLTTSFGPGTACALCTLLTILWFFVP